MNVPKMRKTISMLVALFVLKRSGLGFLRDRER